MKDKLNNNDLISEIIYYEKENKFVVKYSSLKEEVYEELDLFDDKYEKIIELVMNQYGKSFEELENMGIIKIQKNSNLENVIKNCKIKNLITRKKLVSLLLTGTLMLSYFCISNVENSKNLNRKNQKNSKELEDLITPSPNKPLGKIETIEASKLPTLEPTVNITEIATIKPTPPCLLITIPSNA